MLNRTQWQNDQVLIRSWCLFQWKWKLLLSDSLIWHVKLTLALFLNLIGDVTVFFSNIRIYVSYLWAVIISTFFVCSMKTSPWSERGLSSVTRLWIRSLKFDLLYIRYHSRYDVGLDTDTENSLLLGVRFSLTKFAQRKNLTKASWQ